MRRFSKPNQQNLEVKKDHSCTFILNQGHLKSKRSIRPTNPTFSSQINIESHACQAGTSQPFTKPQGLKIVSIKHPLNLESQIYTQSSMESIVTNLKRLESVLITRGHYVDLI